MNNEAQAKPLPVPTEPMEIGPACQKLTPRQFRFAVALVYEVPPGAGAPEAAATVAGYSTDDRGRLCSYARKLAHSPPLVAAVEELLRQRLTLDAPQALDVLRKAMTDQYGKDKVKAAGMLLDRVLPVKQELKVTAEAVDHTKDAVSHLRRMKELGVTRDVLVREFGEIGLARWEALLAAQEAAKPIDAEYTVIEREPIAALSEELEEITGEPETVTDDDDEELEF